MAGRFAAISDKQVKEFTEKLENENTKKKTLHDINVLYFLFAIKPSRICKTLLHLSSLNYTLFCAF